MSTEIVTFLFMDIEGSLRLWEEQPYTMRAFLVRYETMAVDIIEQHKGKIFMRGVNGDSLYAVFADATEALKVAYALQLVFILEPGPSNKPLRIRMALHTGEVDSRDEQYHGPAFNLCTHLRDRAGGWQTFISLATYREIRKVLPPGTLRDLGQVQLDDLERPEHIFQLKFPVLPD